MLSKEAVIMFKRTIINILMFKRTIFTDVVQGILLGGGLALITATLIINAEVKAMQTVVNGWSNTLECGEPGNGILLRAACAKILPAVNLAEEVVYWTTTIDSMGQTLSGQHDYILHFAAGQLPPNDAFWSLTMDDIQNHLVPNSINRYSVGGRSDLVPNADGSIDIYIQNTAPTGHESNWLPAPSGDFMLYLRAYLPDQTILDGEYKVPPVDEVK